MKDGGGGFRGQEIRIRVINNFCSVMKPRERERGGLSAQHPQIFDMFYSCPLSLFSYLTVILFLLVVHNLIAPRTLFCS